MSDLTQNEIEFILKNPGCYSSDTVFVAQRQRDADIFQQCEAALLNSPAMKLAIAHVNQVNRESLPQNESPDSHSVDAGTLAQDMMHFLHEIHMSQQEAIDNPEKAIAAIIKLW